MKKKEVEKTINTIFKERCSKLIIPNYIIKIKKQHIVINNKDNIPEGDILYTYLSDKHCQLGAITTLHLYGSIAQGTIGQILNNIYPNPRYPFITGFYNFPQTTKYMGGPEFSFYQTDDIEERINFLIDPIKNDIIPRFNNFLNCKENLIDDILSHPSYYRCPYAISLILLYYHNKNNIDNITELREKAQIAKLQDIKYASDIEDKIHSYFMNLSKGNK